MFGSRPPKNPRTQILLTLHALGGEGTLGDLVVITGLSREEIEREVEQLIASGEGQIRVFEHGDVTYHLGKHKPSWRTLGGVRSPRRTARDLAKRRRVWLDRKTLRLIRAREGVISLAELVEQTGLPLAQAQKEMERLARDYGGEPHVSLDGHVVHAFPEVMTSMFGRFAGREPRPAWVRCHDPMVHPRKRRGLRGILRLDRFFRFRRVRTVRRYALGHVIETALSGKGVVSLDRTVKFLQARAGKKKVRRSVVEAALRELAREFDAPITREGRDLFFGFRNVKRQFLASHLVRRQLGLARTVAGRTVYDTADSDADAFARELEAFDQQLHLIEPTELSDSTQDRHTPPSP